MTITSTLRFLHGCIQSTTESDTFYIPNLMKLSTDGLFYADNNATYHTDLNLIAVNPMLVNGNTGVTVSKVEFTPNTSMASVAMCSGTSSEPVIESVCILNPNESKCASSSQHLMGGHSCDVTLTTENNTLEIFLPSFMLGVADHETYIAQKDAVEVSLPIAKEDVYSYILENNAIYEIEFYTYENNNLEYFDAPDYTELNEVFANNLSPQDPVCQTNNMGVCDLLTIAAHG